jgi:hypothetical protein
VWQKHTLFLCKFSLLSAYFCSFWPQSKGTGLPVKLLELYGIYLGTRGILPSADNKITDTVRSYFTSYTLKDVLLKI